MKTEIQKIQYIPATLIPEAHTFPSITGRRPVIFTVERREALNEIIAPIEGVRPLSRVELIEFIKSEGCDPFEWIYQQIKRGFKIIGIGNIHISPQMDKQFTDLIEKTARIEDPKNILIAIELERSYQDAIDKYLLGKGELPSRIYYRNSPRFTEAMEMAKDKGISVTCVLDYELILSSDKGSCLYLKTGMDERMHERVIQLHTNHPDKLIFWNVGSGHISSRHQGLPDQQFASALTIPEFLSIYQEVMDGIEIPRLVASNPHIQRYEVTPLEGSSIRDKSQYYGNYTATIFLPK